MMTVMFSSRNGSAVLPRVLDAMTRAHPPAGGWKVIAVDNASTDNSAEIMRAYRDRLPITVLSEPVPGKNRGLNRALELAEGDFYIFCDDDVVVAEDWLVQWREAADSHAAYDLFGGRVEPLWPDDLPHWVLDEVSHSIVFGTNLHMHEGPCDAIAMFGTNMAIRALGIRKRYPVQREYRPGQFTGLSHGKRNRTGAPAGGPRLQGLVLGRRARPAHHPAASDGAPVDPDARLPLGPGTGAHEGEAQLYAGPPGAKKLAALESLSAPTRFYSHGEAWARQWEWAIDQGYEDGWRESRNLSARWMRNRKGPHVAARFRALTAS